MPKQVFISYSSYEKHIADSIFYHLEKENIPCWIASRDIDGNPIWDDTIMKGLRNSDVFVVVISANSIASSQFANEVANATRICQYLLPFKVDNETLSDGLQYHLERCQWIDATNGPLEDSIQKLVYTIQHLSELDAKYCNHRRLMLKERILPPKNVFVGRENELSEIAERLPDDHILFLRGMGGIGKSEIAKAYARQYRNRYEIILFTEFTTNLADLIEGEQIQISNLVRPEGESDDEWIKRKLDALNLLVTSRMLLIIDNFDTEYDPLLDTLRTLPCHILVTTRYEHMDYPSITIGQISDFDKVRNLFLFYYGRKINDPDLPVIDEILQLVRCHTITVELIAKQMRASYIKPAEMLKKLQESGLNTHLKEKIRKSDAEGGQTAFGYIQALFQMSGLSESEQHLLRCMSLVPYSGIPRPVLGEILNLDDYDGINSLVANSWLSYSDDDDLLSLHPVICDVVREELRPTAAGCGEYVHGLYKCMQGSWFFSIEKKNMLYPLLRFYLHLFPDPVPELWEEYLDFINIPWICNDFGTAVETGERTVRYAVEHFGEATTEAGYAAYYLGTAYHNSGDDEQAEIWYKEALKHWKVCLAPDDARLAIVYMKIGRCACLRGDLKKAAELYQLSGDIYSGLLHRPETWTEEEKSPPHYRDYLVELERLAMAEGRFEDALAMSRDTHVQICKVHGNESAPSVFTLTDMGICCSMLGMYEQADDYLEQALRISLKVLGEFSLPTIRIRESIADNSLRSGDYQQAKDRYTELAFDVEKVFGPDSAVTKHIQGKRAAM